MFSGFVFGVIVKMLHDEWKHLVRHVQQRKEIENRNVTFSARGVSSLKMTCLDTSWEGRLGPL